MLISAKVRGFFSIIYTREYRFAFLSTAVVFFLFFAIFLLLYFGNVWLEKVFIIEWLFNRLAPVRY